MFEILTVWFMLLGLSLVIGKAAGGKWFLNATKKAVMAPIKAGGKAGKKAASDVLKAFWKKYRSEILALGIGIGFAKTLFESQLWILILLLALIFIAGWLIGLAIASYQGRRDEYTDFCREAIGRAGRNLWANHKWKITWFVIGMVTYMLFPGPHF